MGITCYVSIYLFHDKSCPEPEYKNLIKEIESIDHWELEKVDGEKYNLFLKCHMGWLCGVPCLYGMHYFAYHTIFEYCNRWVKEGEAGTRGYCIIMADEFMREAENYEFHWVS